MLVFPKTVKCKVPALKVFNRKSDFILYNPIATTSHG